MGVYDKLSEVQRKLKAPKNQHNSFGNYNYRSCEDILEGVKPLLDDATLYITDEIIQVGDRFYVKATATFRSGPDSITASAYAREQTDKKGMDQSQVTGAASSYARKYALNGLFLIDDTKDADTMDNRNGEQPEKKEKPKKEVKEDLTTEKAAFAAHCAELALSEPEITALKKYLFKQAPTKAELAAVNEKFNDHFDAFVAQQTE